MTDDPARDTKSHNQEKAGGMFRHRTLKADGQPNADQWRGRAAFSPPSALSSMIPAQVWESLWTVKLDPRHLIRQGLFTDPLTSRMAGQFDLLRARLLLTLTANNWSRIAVTSPARGTGKSFVAINLALSLSRLPACRTILLDLDLRAPRLAPLLGLQDMPPLRDCLMGEQPLESQLRRVGSSLALALNGQAVPRAYEILQDPSAIRTLQDVHDRLQPDVTLMDMPPILETDDVLAMAPHLDAVLLVTDGTSSTAVQIDRCLQAIEGHVPLLGVVLNKAQDRDLRGLARNRRMGL